MKKLLVGLLIVCFLVIPIVCFSDEGNTHSQVIYTQYKTVTSNTWTSFSDTAIRPNVDKIIGIGLVVNSGTSGTVVMYDSTSSNVATSELITETEATSTCNGTTIFFPFPRSVLYGVTINQSANTTVIIYYISQ